jgi:hypothetical protein
MDADSPELPARLRIGDEQDVQGKVIVLGGLGRQRRRQAGFSEHQRRLEHQHGVKVQLRVEGSFDVFRLPEAVLLAREQ